MILFRKYYLIQLFTFIITFFAYAFLHANRKSFSNVKSTLKLVWTEELFNKTTPKLYPKEIWRSHNLFSNENSAELFLGFLDTIFMGCYAVGLFISGYLGDRFDPRYVLGIGMSVSSIVIFFFGVVTEWFHFYNVYLYTILFGLNGLCQSTGWPAAVAIMGNWFGHSRGFWLCLWSSNAYVGNILGDLLTGKVITYGYQFGFFVPSLFLFSAGLVVITSTVTTPGHMNAYKHAYQLITAHTDDNDDIDVPINVEQNTEKLSFLKICLIPGVIPYSLAYASLKMVNYAFFFWLPVYLYTFGWSNEKADNVSIWFDVGSIVGGIITGLISDFMWSRSPITVFSLLCTIVSLAIYKLTPGVVWENSLFLALIGFFIGGPANLISSTIAADLGSQPMLTGNKAALSSVTGIVDGTGSVGAALGQICIPLLAQTYHWSSVFVFFMIMISLTVICLIPVLFRDIRRLIRERNERRNNVVIEED